MLRLQGVQARVGPALGRLSNRMADDRIESVEREEKISRPRADAADKALAPNRAESAHIVIVNANDLALMRHFVGCVVYWAKVFVGIGKPHVDAIVRSAVNIRSDRHELEERQAS